MDKTTHFFCTSVFGQLVSLIDSKAIADSEDELTVKMKVYITHDFVMEVLSYGDRVTVIKPERLIKEIKDIYADALNQY